eukprot:7999904-Prorocentrum_lima.AAC.1
MTSSLVGSEMCIRDRWKQGSRMSCLPVVHGPLTLPPHGFAPDVSVAATNAWGEELSVACQAICKLHGEPPNGLPLLGAMQAVASCRLFPRHLRQHPH